MSSDACLAVWTPDKDGRKLFGLLQRTKDIDVDCHWSFGVESFIAVVVEVDHGFVAVL